MSWKEFSVAKVLFSMLVLLIGLILKFPKVLESLPPKYRIIGIIFTESQYFIINIISIAIIIISLVYLVILVADKFRK